MLSKAAIVGFAVFLFLFFQAYAEEISLEGTWSSKSNTVFTGPGFFDPVDELLIEPALPGRSYSFTSDGYWEEALYIVTANSRNHSCPTAVLQFQHGRYEILSNGSLSLMPFESDGRQLLSAPCDDGGVSIYSRYIQSELFKAYTLSIDDYHGQYKLQLYQFDGAPIQPLYLAYKPPMMLPTQVLNPTNSQDTDIATETETSLRKRVRRSLEIKQKLPHLRKSNEDRFDSLWYVALGIFSLGGFCYAFF
ncbi:Rot1p ASCRUDRAFT_35651 [Ascoidea rubescens DSM 1968]|uniref:Protein ROT1 n=1 Tax=Ascoidea rubescens DSM 1968 TaxID=1344418 RepID=A0A1D2VFR1_9ASCO|nr:hypothetical protein ASCRUDRAFT_35651 [Ascoidea rubescens DSM 1968]ODV60439.1 hypothetical protein ASCRUDRAFT_35651 [Ascoidea rubescens DSM 1968]